MMRRGFPVLAVLALLSGALGACQSSQPETPRGPTGQLEQVLLTDVDGDGDGDLVSVGDFADGPIRVQQRGTAAVLPDVTATLALPTSGSGRRVASGDLDGDGDLDVLGKPYNWDAPRLDAWINEGPAKQVSGRRPSCFR